MRNEWKRNINNGFSVTLTTKEKMKKKIVKIPEFIISLLKA